jgi:signal transduction histidine kinase
VRIAPEPDEAPRTWFCIPVAVIGILASLALGLATRHDEDAQIRAGLETQATALAKGIEMRLDQQIKPLSVLASTLEALPMPSADYFAIMARNVQALGVPFGRLGWQPRVPSARKEAFEAEARAAGLTDYRILRFPTGGAPDPMEPRADLFPFRLESTLNGAPSILGYDIASEPDRCAAIDLARDLGEPVAMRPRASRSVQSQRSSYVIYWPLYQGGAHPTSKAERRERLSGYVTVFVYIDDLLKHAMRDMPPLPETILFRARNPGDNGPLELIGRYDRHTGLTVPEPDTPEPPRSVSSFDKVFSLLHQTWALTLSFPDTFVAERRSVMPLLVGILGMVVTLGLTAVVFAMARAAENDRADRRGTEILMEELAEANRALTLANAQLSARERASTSLAHARTRFLASASHDLRQPLHALALFTTALARRVTDPTAIELVGNIHELGLSMQGMFNSLLDLSRLDTGAIEPRIGHCDLDGLIARLIAEYAPRAQLKGVNLRKAGRFPPMETDAGLIESVLRNLIDNAVKFTDHGGVLVAGRPRGTAWVIEIWDTGPGIGADETDRIFEEFERLEATVKKPGFGLGLPIVRKLCALIGATVAVCSRPGRGSRFAVTLPSPLASRLAPAEAVSVPPRVDGGKTILLVDDDPAVLRALSLELSDCGHRTLVADNTDDAMRLIASDTAFGMAILDLRLGGRHNGWVLAGAWRTRRPDAPVILMTGSTDALTLRQVRDSGLPTLFKPVAPSLLHRVIADPLAWARHPSPTP